MITRSPTDAARSNEGPLIDLSSLAALRPDTGYCRIDRDAPVGTEIVAGASFDAIRIGSLLCAIRMLPRVMPAKNAAMSIKIIVPSFRGGLAARNCLSKSFWSRWSIFDFFQEKFI